MYFKMLHMLKVRLIFKRGNNVFMTGFPCSSAGNESVSIAGDLGLIRGLEDPPGQGIGYPLQYSWGSMVTQMVKNPPALGGIWVRS